MGTGPGQQQVRPQACALSLTHIDAGLEHLNRLATLGTLSAGAAHEIKNALVPLKTFVDLLLETSPDAEHALLVRSELERVNGLLKQMLQLSAPPRPEVRPQNVHTLIDEALKLTCEQARVKGIRIERDFSAPHHTVAADAGQLKQVLLNVILNAVEAMGEQGTLSIQTVVRGDMLEMTFSDTGYGINPDHLDQLFKPFFTTKDGGTGLGLAIAKEIVIAHKGSISASNRPGRGAAFQILLPLCATEMAPANT